jgi:hypothetical protein
MTCRSCGSTIADKAIVCYRCGTPTADPATAAAPARRPRPFPRLAMLAILAILALSAWTLVRSEAGAQARWVAGGGAAAALLGSGWLARRR